MNKNLVLLFLITVVFFYGCERDDICAESTPTTPRIVIEFYDVANTETLKSVTNLVVFGEGQDTPIPFDDDSVIKTTSTVSLPLSTTSDSTTFILYSDTQIDEDGNILDSSNPDTLTITYAREEVYVSRACGYKTTFINFLPDLLDEGPDNWIEANLRAEGITNIENENQTHLNIRH